MKEEGKRRLMCDNDHLTLNDGKIKKSKVFFSIDTQVNEQFEKYCDDNFINKSKIIEGLIKLLVQNPTEITELLKNKN